MSVTAQLTMAEFLKLPRKPGKQELIDGELIELPPAKKHHGIIARRIIERLEAAVPKSRVWHEMGFQLGEHWLQPDVSVLHEDQPTKDDWYQGSPLVAIEVVSPANTAEEIDRKVGRYLEHGAAEVWAVYPKTRSLTVFTPDGRAERRKDLYNSPVLGVEIHIPAITE